MQSTGDSSAENSDVNFYQPITIHEIIENLKKDRSVDASLYKKENTADIISDRLQSGTSIEALLVKPNVEGTNDALIHQILVSIRERVCVCNICLFEWVIIIMLICSNGVLLCW